MKTAKSLVLAVVTLGLAYAASAQTPPIPIPMNTTGDKPVEFIGNKAIPKYIFSSPIPQNPYMDYGSFAAIHNDTYMSDTYPTISGPLGLNPETFSTYLVQPTTDIPNPQAALVVGMTFDAHHGPLVAGVNLKDEGKAQVQLKLIDPNTLATIASFNEMPLQTITSTLWRPAGTYFYADQKGRTVIGTSEPSVWVVSHNQKAFTGYKKIPLNTVIPVGDNLQAVQPDFQGRVWFTSKGGLVGTLNINTGKVLGTYRLPNQAGIKEGELIDNGSASDETGGVFIASNEAMYRFDADSQGAPVVSWREPYTYGDNQKSGQVDIGTGTTPTLMGSKFVTITDNAEPQMHVLVYRREKKFNGNRLICSEPVFQPMTSATENSLVATEKSIVVENNYGYSDPSATQGGKTTTPGITRIDLDRNGCHTVWENDEVSIPSLVTKMSLKNGLIYTYSKPKDASGTDAWYFTSIDFKTGQIVNQQLAGTGDLYNNHYSALYLGPDGTVYVGVFGGIVAMRDHHDRWHKEH